MHDAAGSDAASVASQLLAFYREPVRHRPRLIHGHETIAGGHHVLRFAQGKFPHGLLRDLTRAQREELRRAARAFIRQVCFWDGATHYQVLCVPPFAKRELVKEHYHLMMALIHPDRQDRDAGSDEGGAATDPWPTGCAQRVNGAYEMLSSTSLRREYDAGLDKAAAAPAQAADLSAIGMPRAGRRRTTAAGIAKPVVVVTGVSATLFFLQLWWVSDVPGEHTILERAFPIQASAQWMRDVLAAAQPPKFLAMLMNATRDDRAPDGDSKEPERGSLLGSLLPSRDREPQATRRDPALAVAPSGAVEPQSSVAPPPVAQASPPRDELPTRLEPPAAARAPAASPPPAGTQAASAGAIRSEDIEILVARLVSYYEAGDVDRVMALVDARETGAWRAVQSRNVFSEFFRATKQRRLRLNNLSWQIASDAATAKGDATLRFEYFDGAGMAERRIDVEMDLRLRDGHLRIARLVLFPSDP